MAFSVGETLQADKYRLHALLDQHEGGMTFLATHQSVDQQVVIKVFRSTDQGPSRLQLDSYIDYAKKLRRFHHPNLSRVISVFEEEGHACMVSEFIQGMPLSQLIQKQPLDETTAITYIRQVAQGLHALHRHGLLHLNLSPSRILKRQGDSKAVLVGLNSRFASQEAERHSNPYLSFEQHQTPANPSLASEIYSISAVLYTLVTGVTPRPACDRIKTPLIPPRQRRAELSQSLEEAILAGMALAPSDRPQRMKEWIKLLPQPLNADAKTKLQIPSAWQVKLPAFRDAGMEESVSTVIETGTIPDQKTTLQTNPPSPSVLDPGSGSPGHSELDLHHHGADPLLNSASVPDATTLQVQPQPTTPVLAVSTPSTDSIDKAQTPSKNESSMPFVPTSTGSNMSVSLPRRTSRFPKWSLFWCALLAACGGLAAGLWFRIQLTRQFAMPPTPVESSPLDQLKTLDKREEEFLPTQTSIIPEEKKSQDQGDAYEFETPTDSTVDSDLGAESTDPEFGERGPIEDWREPSPWSRQDGSALDDPIPAPGVPTADISTEPVDPLNPTENLTSSPYEYDSAGQPVDQPIESENFDPALGDPYVESVGEESYTSDGSYDPNSGTF